MPSIPYLLMKELSELETEAKKTDQYSRAQTLATCVDIVNSLHHGRPAGEVFIQCRDIFLDNAKMSMIEADEVEAYNDAVLVLELLAEQFALKL